MSHPAPASASKDLPLSVFVYEGQVYTSSTRILFPASGPPPPHDSPTAKGIPPSSTWLQCMWAKRDYLELAFYPVSSRLFGSAFQSLRFLRQDTIPLTARQAEPYGPIQYRTPYADEWRQLEGTLIQVQNLLQAHRTIPVLVTLNKQDMRWPSSEGYGNWTTNREVAQRKVFFTRRKFLYQIAIISFHIATFSYRSRDPHLWYDYLIENGIPGHILDSLSASVVADFTPNTPRAGVFVKPDDCTWPTYLPVLIHAKVPVFVCWGPVNAMVKAPKNFDDLKPSEQAVSAVSPVSRAANHSVLDESDTRPPSVAGEPPRFLPTDTPGTFFAARAVYRNAFVRDVENEKEKAARLSREKRATRFRVTDLGANKVFEWEYDCEPMRWTRVQVLPRERSARWREFGPQFKRYDSVAKEWDLAWFLDYNTCAQQSIGEGIDDILEGEDEEDEERQPHLPSPFFCESDYQLDPPPPHGYPDSDASVANASFADTPVANASFVDTSFQNEPFEVEDGEVSHGTTAPASSQTSTPVTTPMAVQPSTTPMAIQPSTTTTVQLLPRPVGAMTSWIPTASSAWMPTATSAWMPAANTAPTTSGTDSTTLAHEDGELDADEEWHPRFPTLMAVLMARHLFRWGVSDLPDVPNNKLLDWSDACRAVGFAPTKEIKDILDGESLNRSANLAKWVSCTVLQTPLPVDWWLLAPKSPVKLRELLRETDIRIFDINDPYQQCRLWCLDDKRNPRYMRTWFIGVENPSTVLTIAMTARSIDEAARWMLISGVKFRTLLYSARATALVKQAAPMTDTNLHHRLLMRPTNYSFTASDFHVYEDVRDWFLRSNPRIARAALMAGGILWRLAIEAVDRTLVLNGPDSLAYARKITFALRDSADNVFVDDVLSTDEVHLILGAYIREPASRRNFEGAGLPMWWPSGHFEGSALDFGWWSPLAESWYCTQRAEYRTGVSQPKTGRQWRNILRNRDRRARIFTENSKAAAAMFLGGVST